MMMVMIVWCFSFSGGLIGFVHVIRVSNDFRPGIISHRPPSPGCNFNDALLHFAKRQKEKKKGR